MRYLGEQLAARGVRVRGVKLAGHAGTPEALGAAGYDNWYESVVNGLEELRQYREPIAVVGLSMGAVLAARLSADQSESIAGVTLLAPAFFLPTSTTLALRSLRGVLGSLVDTIYLHQTVGSDIHDAAAQVGASHLPPDALVGAVEAARFIRAGQADARAGHAAGAGDACAARSHVPDAQKRRAT